jgi:hypothetical protein
MNNKKKKNFFLSYLVYKEFPPLRPPLEKLLWERWGGGGKGRETGGENKKDRDG